MGVSSRRLRKRHRVRSSGSTSRINGGRTSATPALIDRTCANTLSVKDPSRAGHDLVRNFQHHLAGGGVGVGGSDHRAPGFGFLGGGHCGHGCCLRIGALSWSCGQRWSARPRRCGMRGVSPRPPGYQGSRSVVGWLAPVEPRPGRAHLNGPLCTPVQAHRERAAGDRTRAALLAVLGGGERAVAAVRAGSAPPPTTTSGGPY